MKSFAIFALGTLASVAAVAQAPMLTTASTVRDLLANPTTAAVLKADIPQIVNNPQIQMGMDMQLAAIAQFEPEALSPDNLKKIDADLAKAQKAAPKM